MVKGEGDPIIETRVSGKFAFVQLRSIEETNNMLNLNGIPYEGANLRIGRPSKYTGPVTPAVTWHELMGQPPPTTLQGSTSASQQNKLMRELFVGNTPSDTTEHHLISFLNQAMLKVELNTNPGDAVVNCRLSEKFAFVECRSVEEANNLLLMDQIPYIGMDGSQNYLRINRPSKYQGPVTPIQTWDQTLLKMTEEGPKTQVIRLSNMVTDEDLATPEAYQELLEDAEDTFKPFGNVDALHIPKAGTPGALFVFVKYSNPNEAEACKKAMSTRTFDGKPVVTKFYEVANFDAGIFDAAPAKRSLAPPAPAPAMGTPSISNLLAMNGGGLAAGGVAAGLPIAGGDVGASASAQNFLNQMMAQQAPPAAPQPGAGGGGRGRGMTLPAWATK